MFNTVKMLSACFTMAHWFCLELRDLELQLLLIVCRGWNSLDPLNTTVT